MNTVPRSSIHRFLYLTILTISVFLSIAADGKAAPIQKVQGVITEVGEGYLLLKPDDKAAPMRFILRWKAHFVPAKVPFPGDRVLILYKDKEEGAIIYGVNYLSPAFEGLSGPDNSGKNE